MSTQAKALLPCLIVWTLVACGGGSSSSSPTPTQPAAKNLGFEVRMTNLTTAQPFSPPAIFLHQSGYTAFTDGSTASKAIETLAEGGDRSEVIAEVRESGKLLATYTDTNPIAPSSQGPLHRLYIAETNAGDVKLTVVSMLVHTNDAFTGVNAVDVTGMAVGESRTLNGPTWDAGTEANTETAATMPGPDFGGVGFAAARDDAIDRVRFHQGVVTSAAAASGDANSALEEKHRFDNPTSRLVITRVE